MSLVTIRESYHLPSAQSQYAVCAGVNEGCTAVGCTKSTWSVDLARTAARHHLLDAGRPAALYGDQADDAPRSTDKPQAAIGIVSSVAKRPCKDAMSAPWVLQVSCTVTCSGGGLPNPPASVTSGARDDDTSVALDTSFAAAY
jgi:hypothetical protein